MPMRGKNLLKKVFPFLSVRAHTHTLCAHACVGGMLMHLVGNLFFLMWFIQPKPRQAQNLGNLSPTTQEDNAQK